MGLAPMRMSTRSYTSLLYSMLVDDCASGLSTRFEARKTANEIIEALSTDAIAAGQPRAIVTPPPSQSQVPDRATWGLLPEHQAGLRKAMGILGGPN